MSSHVNLVVSGDIRAQHEKTLNAERAIRPGEWGGPDTTANLRAMKAGVDPTKDLCDRLAAAAKERGRPLTTEESAKIYRGETLPPVTVAKPVKDRVGELEATVRLLTERLDALEQAQKSSTPSHLAKVERR